MPFDKTERNLRELLIGRTVVDACGVKGKIISAMPTRKHSGCEVSVRFNDGIYTLENRFDAQTWFNNSTK